MAIADDTTWTGKLVSRDSENLTISQKGRIVTIPLSKIRKVELAN